MDLSFRTKLLLSYVGLVVAVVGLASFELNRSLSADLMSRLDERLEAQADGLVQWGNAGRHPNRRAARFANLVGAEIAVIDPGGVVLSFATPSAGSAEPVSPEPGAPDAALPDLPPQNDQPEVRAARESGKGHATHAAATSNEVMRYVAVAAKDGLVLRLGVPVAGVEATLGTMRFRLAFAAMLAIAAAAAIGVVASKRIARPLRAMAGAAAKIAAGDYEVRVESTSPDELGELATALAEMAAQLKGRIGDLTAERDRLKALLAQVRRLEAVRRDFVANVSHELRTPVTAIQGYSETLLSGMPDVETRERFLQTIHRHAQRLGRVLEDLLRLSAIEAQAPDAAAREPIELYSLVLEVARSVEERRRAMDAAVHIDVPEDVVALGDPLGVEQVLENLLDNALKYGGTGGRVTITARRAEGAVELSVQDRGPGVAPEHLPRLFERFYRVDPARSREQGGAGLGLAIVKNLVERMGGAVAAASTLGQGCCFTVTLPAAPT